MSPGRPAVFLDRDGTIIEDTHYVSRPESVRVIPGVAAAIARLNEARLPVVVISNQSGIGRGMFGPREYERVKERIDELLAAEGARLDATYVCPHYPPVSGPCDCRKPGTLLYRQASADLELDLARSAFVGDRWRDVEPGVVLGGRGILVPSPETPMADRERAEVEAEVVASLGDAVARIVGC